MAYKVSALSLKVKNGTLYATWTIKPSGDFVKSNIENYKYHWYYYSKGMGSKTFDGGSGSTSNASINAFTISSVPDTATKVWINVQPVSKTHKVTTTKNGKKTTTDKAWFASAWTSSSKYNWEQYLKDQEEKANNTEFANSIPSAPEVTCELISGMPQITAVVDTYKTGYKAVEFALRDYTAKKQIRVIKITPSGGMARVVWGGANYSTTKEYDVSCRILNKNSIWSKWSNYSSTVQAEKVTPSTPEIETEPVGTNNTSPSSSYLNLKMTLNTFEYTGARKVEFCIYQNNVYLKSYTVSIVNNKAVCRHTMTQGKTYKVRCRLVYSTSTVKSNYSDFSGVFSTGDQLSTPPAPSFTQNGKVITITCNPTDETSNAVTDYIRFNIVKIETVTTSVPVATSSSPNPNSLNINGAIAAGGRNDTAVFPTRETTTTYMTSVKTVDAPLDNSKNIAGITFNTSPGCEYQVRCRAMNNSGEGTEWSGYSSSFYGFPGQVIGLRAKALNSTTISLTWSKVLSAKSYKVEYTTDKKYFDMGINIQTATSNTNSLELSVQSGNVYYIRVRAVDEHNQEGLWSTITSAVCGKTPTAPTTWSSVYTAKLGDKVILYWVHNTSDGSSQVSAKLRMTVRVGGNPAVIEKEIPNQYLNDEDHKDDTSYYIFDTSTYSSDINIKWKVATCGVTGTYSPYSVEREINVYQPPTVGIALYRYLNVIDGGTTTTIGSKLQHYPFYIACNGSPATQTPIGCTFTIYVGDMTNTNTSDEDSYEITDAVGNTTYVAKGHEVYNKTFNYIGSNSRKTITDNVWVWNTSYIAIHLTPGDVHLEDGMTYTVYVKMAFNSGLTAENNYILHVDFEDSNLALAATYAFDETNYAAHITPMCFKPASNIVDDIYEVEDYIDAQESAADKSGYDPGTDTSGAIQEPDEDSDTEVLFSDIPTVPSNTPMEQILYDKALLSVYRREFDGSFTLIDENIPNNGYFTVVDPHPSLKDARYRLVAMDQDNGKIVFEDSPAIPLNWTPIIIQWDEQWSAYDRKNYTTEELDLNNSYDGSMLVLPYNVDISESNEPDSEFVEYIGRENPVSYYGTQIGSSANWSCVIPAYDEETLYGLRRLSRYMGDVYVREPSGTGYWANVKVSISKQHREVTIPVSLTVKRVEGGL